MKKDRKSRVRVSPLAMLGALLIVVMLQDAPARARDALLSGIGDAVCAHLAG